MNVSFTTNSRPRGRPIVLLVTPIEDKTSLDLRTWCLSVHNSSPSIDDLLHHVLVVCLSHHDKDNFISVLNTYITKDV